MSFQEIIDFIVLNWQLIVGGILLLLIVYLFIRRLIRTARMYLGAKNFVKKSKKLRKKKFNGFQLVDSIKNKRKRNTNSYEKLRRRAKRKVLKYINYKAEELPTFARYSYGKLLKRASDKLLIIFRGEKRTLEKISIKKVPKQLLEATNKYDCLNELIIFLHGLPQAILDKKEAHIFVREDDIQITYLIK